MQINHVDGKNKGKVILYALSTCVWCRKTKNLLNTLGVEYSYIDMDKLSHDDKKRILDEMAKFNPACTFPTMIVDDDICIRGYKEDNIKKALE